MILHLNKKQTQESLKNAKRQELNWL